MTRLIYLHAYPWQVAHELSKCNDYSVLAKSRLAAKSLVGSQGILQAEVTKHLVSQGWEIVSPLEAHTVLCQVIQEIVQPTDLVGMARAWMPTIQFLLQGHAHLDNVFDLQCEHLSSRTQVIFQVAREYQQRLHTQNKLDMCELYWRAAEVPPKSRKVLVYGLYQPRRDELTWLNKIAAAGSILCLPCSEHEVFDDIRNSIKWLIAQGWQVMTESNQPQTLGETLSNAFLQENTFQHLPGIHCYGTFEAEIRGTLAQVKYLLNQGTPAKEIAIIAKDEIVYGPNLIDIGWEYGVPLRALYDTPMLSTRLGAWLSLLFRVIQDRFPFESMAKLLSHPICSNPDEGFWALIRQEHPNGLAQWQNITQQHLQIDLSVFSHINQSRRRDTWVEWWQNLLKQFDLRLRCGRWARESIAFNRFSEALVHLSKPEDDVLSWLEFRQALVDVLESLSVPAQPGRGGVELHKPSSVIGARYRHLFVVGMAEGILPKTISNDPVLDFFERRQLRGLGISLPLAAEQARRESIYFYHLLQTATDQVTFSYAKLKGKHEQLASPYLERLGLMVTEPPEKPIASLEEWRKVYLRQYPETEDAVFSYACRAFDIEHYRESASPPDEYDGVVGIPFNYSKWIFSASQLTSLGQCSFKWFANKRLKLREPFEVEDELSPSLRGNLYHRVLEQLIKKYQVDPSVEFSNIEILRTTFLEVEDKIDLPELPAWSVQREDHIQTLSRVLKKPDFLHANASPIRLEETFIGEWQGLKIMGRVDRIDRTPDGLILIDYKTSASKPKGIKDTNGKACIDVQLSLYQEVAAPNLEPNETVIDAYYYSLTKGKPLRGNTKPQKALVDAIARCKQQLDQGSYPVQPDVDKVACQYCEFDPVCRQGKRLSRKENCYEVD